jgi:hypothetical protein
MALPNNLMNQGPQQNWIGQFNQPIGIGRQESNTPQKGWFDTIKEFFMGTPEHTIYSSPYTQQQMGGFQQLQQMGLENQQNPYAGFENIQQGAEDFYNQQLIPSLSERFASQGRGRGGGGSLSSPDFQQNLRTSSQDFSRQLAGLKAQYGQQNKGFGLQQAQAGLNPLYNVSLQQRTPGAPEQLYNQGADTVKQLLPILGKIATGGL